MPLQKCPLYFLRLESFIKLYLITKIITYYFNKYQLEKYFSKFRYRRLRGTNSADKITAKFRIFHKIPLSQSWHFKILIIDYKYLNKRFTILLLHMTYLLFFTIKIQFIILTLFAYFLVHTFWLKNKFKKLTSSRHN